MGQKRFLVTETYILPQIILYGPLSADSGVNVLISLKSDRNGQKVTIHIKNDGMFLSDENTLKFSFMAETANSDIRNYVGVSTENHLIAMGSVETENLDKDGNLVLIVHHDQKSDMRDKVGFSVIIDKSAGFIIFRDMKDHVRLAPFIDFSANYDAYGKSVLVCDMRESDILPFSSHTGLNRPVWTKCDEDDIQGITDYLDDLLMGDKYGHIGLIARNLARIS